MMRFTNFKLYTPENPDIPNLNIGYLISDEGTDWYECQSSFSEKTLKIVFDQHGLIRSYSKDISMLWPVGLSVTEIASEAVPTNLDITGNWMFDGEKIIPHQPSKEELMAEAEKKKTRLINEVSKSIAPLQDAVDLGIATDKEKESLEQWKKYRVLLNRVDISTAPDIEWPVEPSAQVGK